MALAAQQAQTFTNTLDEPIGKTLGRDLKNIGRNVINVLLPFNLRGSSRSRDERMNALLRDWDLWGPLLFSLSLALMVSIGQQSPSKVFTIVYGILLFGGAITTVNVNLLGGRIQFFQSMCLLGYCLFPIVAGALLCLFIHNLVARMVILGIVLFWSSWASVPFVGGTVSNGRRALAVYPLFLMYCSVSWLVLLRA